jgi:hypothetical protein
MSSQPNHTPGTVKPLKPQAPTSVAGSPAAEGEKAANSAAPKAPKEPKAPKAPKEPKESNFKKVYPDSAVITLLTKEGANPKRPGTKAHERFKAYGSGGITVAEALKAGATYSDMSWNVGHGFMKIEVPAAK